MGNSRSGPLSKEILQELQLSTHFSEEELCAWYRSFLKECPGGRITRQQFQSLYAKFFPDADPKAYAQHVFRSFDANSDGTLDFKEYVIALHMTTAGKPSQKLEWAFSLYDVDGNGAISKGEVLEIVMAIFKMIRPEDVEHLPDDENTPEKRAEKIWGFFGKKDHDKLTEEEFIEGTLANKEILRLIQFEPPKVKERLMEKDKNP
ncbi:PREDICTED: recoverin [Miniopterus natalensis]|uniref:recoverin n=1 Tax=Miniopterus natalensis TaxID=291302 RepID=UPI0007A7048A|nr:PREDICTED: recoverin [Miniopterus natalensis]